MSDAAAQVTADSDTDAEASEPASLIHGSIADGEGDTTVLHPDRANWLAVAEALLDDGYKMCIDLTAVDYLTYPDRPLPAEVTGERFEVVASFLDMSRRRRIRARIQVPADDPTLASLYYLYPGADALEREVFDMFGIVFDGHPDLSRILMPETWEGHPLRKDFAVGSIPVQFKNAPGAR